MATAALDADLLIAEAKDRARRRRLLLLVVAGVLAAGAAGVEVAGLGSSGSSGAVPWIPTKPNLGPAHPPLAPACTASQLKATFGMQGLNMYEAVGGISLVNVSSMPCSLAGRPRFSLAGATPPLPVAGMRKPARLEFDPLAPPVGSLRALRPGRHVSVAVLASIPCAADVSQTCRHSPSASGALLFDAPGGGKIRLLNTVSGSAQPFPWSGGDVLQATRFTPVIPTGPPSSALPLRARILSGGPLVADKPNPSFAARRGSWLSFTVVLTNRSARPFSFGRTCPAYTEQWGVARAQAYVLNCGSVGSIPPGKSVAFAIRTRVPNHDERAEIFSWTLAPHTYKAPGAVAYAWLR